MLILAFAVVGAVLYKVTAPATPGQSGLSVGGLMTSVRRAISRGGHATVTTTHTEVVDPSVTVFRVNTRLLDLRVIGEDRPDIAVELTVRSDGMNDLDAAKLAHEVTAAYAHSGNELVLTMDYPAAGAQQSAIVARVPRRLTLRVENKRGLLDVTGVSAVEVKGNRGQTTVQNVPGQVSVTHRGGALHLSGAGSLRLTAAGAGGEIQNVTGDASIEVTGSHVTIADVGGPLDLRARGSDVTIKAPATGNASLRVDTQSGTLDIEGLRTECRIDGHNTEMHVTMLRAAPITIYNTADDVTVTAPPDGYTLDAVATDGGLTIEDGTLKPAGDDRERSASGAVRGGGPAVTLRATDGHITVRAPARSGTAP